MRNFIIYLLSAYPVRDADDAESISLRRFGDVIAADWGWWRTVTGTLDTLASLPPETWRRLQPPTPPVDARGSIRTLRTWADDVPKSRRWRLRSRLGERVRWYESPEEESH